MVQSQLPLLSRVAAGAGMPAAALLAVVYWRWAGKGAAAALIVAQLFVIVSNALARQAVQTRELKKWIDLERIPVRGEWGSFFLFVAALMIALGVLVWIARVALRSRKSLPAAAPRST
jgi:hypothetical protein